MFIHFKKNVNKSLESPNSYLFSSKKKQKLTNIIQGPVKLGFTEKGGSKNGW